MLKIKQKVLQKKINKYLQKNKVTFNKTRNSQPVNFSSASLNAAKREKRFEHGILNTAKDQLV